MELRPEETILTGKWLEKDGKVFSDHECHRIKYLTSKKLKKIADDQFNKDTLYQDPSDGRYWELTHTYNDTDTSGPPILRCLSREKVKRKYGIQVSI